MRLAILLGAALPLTACVASGAGTGAVTSPSGRPEGPARVEFTTNGGATAQMTITLPDGEVFRGPAVSGQRKPSRASASGRAPRTSSSPRRGANGQERFWRCCAQAVARRWTAPCAKSEPVLASKAVLWATAPSRTGGACRSTCEAVP